MSSVLTVTSTNGAFIVVLPLDVWLDDTVAWAKLLVATDAAIAFFCWLLLPAVTFAPMLPEALLKASSAIEALLAVPRFRVPLAVSDWLTNTSASAKPKVKLASAAESAAALSCWLLSPAAMLTPMLPEALPAVPSVAAASLDSNPFSPTLSLLVCVLLIMARTRTSPLMLMSECSFTFLLKVTLSPLPDSPFSCA